MVPDDVNAWLPFRVRNPRHPDVPITLRQIATHTSSIADREPVYGNSYHRGGDSPVALADFLREYFDPAGKNWSVDNFVEAKPGTYPETPTGQLDVSILQTNLLQPLLGIQDPRKDARIDFVGGIRGTRELEKRVDDEVARVAFSLHATQVEQMMAIADANEIMPPKSTWFEPKLRSGLVVHLFEPG